MFGYAETQSVYKTIIFKFLNIKRAIKSLSGNIPRPCNQKSSYNQNENFNKKYKMPYNDLVIIIRNYLKIREKFIKKH